MASLYLLVWKPKEAKKALPNLGHVKDGSTWANMSAI